MGLNEAEFAELTFKEFDLLCARHEAQEYRQWQRTAHLMCLIFNVHRGKRQRALKVSDILSQEPGTKTKAQSAEAFFKALSYTREKHGKTNIKH